MTIHHSAHAPDEVPGGERSTLRAVAMPTEHGGWSLTLEPVCSVCSSRGRGPARRSASRRCWPSSVRADRSPRAGASSPRRRRRSTCAPTISSKACATEAVRSRSPLRVASWFSAIHASNRSSVPCQPNQSVCARTASGRPRSVTASIVVWRGRPSMRVVGDRPHPRFELRHAFRREEPIDQGAPWCVLGRIERVWDGASEGDR